MKKSEQDSKSSEDRPVNKATMDEPQEELIAAEARAAADDDAGGGRSEDAPPRDRRKPAEPEDARMD